MDLQETIFARDDFTSAIQEKRKEIDELVTPCLHNGGIDDPKAMISDVILAGGSSMIPAIQEQLEDRFGYKKVQSKTEEEVLTSIVRGLAVVGAERNTLFQDVVDCDYGVFVDNTHDIIVIIKKGTPVKNTVIDKLNCQGCYEEVDSNLEDCIGVNMHVYQSGIVEPRHIGKITIQNLHDADWLQYKVFMTIDTKKGMLQVMLYDCIYKEWRDEIPLEQREFNITERR